ncbi:hypothetical protein FA13DRAFT_519823 [Coprinellus micaceus]|uniref:Uncharacterized protein n=1 Tax=Coprinellus micaceus TaxID=71717 RepID=A0A4Y7T981_COPMI|nr:hypothetical protein FA13DRAFT_519823 [Coprinellus micaceus]
MSSIAEGILTVKVERTPVSTVSVLVDGHSVRPSLGAELQNSRSQYCIQRFQHSRGFSGFSSRQLGWGLEPVMARPLKLTHTHTHTKQELGEVNREIQDLECRLTLLRAKRETLHGEVRKYNGLCSSLRGLPQDILVEIFVHCLPQNRHSVLHVTDAPILLTTICRRWRDIALHTPRLWTSFHVVTNSYG